jgi:hypothetical protein
MPPLLESSTLSKPRERSKTAMSKDPGITPTPAKLIDLAEAAGHLAWATEVEIQGGSRTRSFMTQHRAKCRYWIAETRKSIDSHASLVSRVTAAEKALHDLTPGGSEFVGDVPRCVEWIRKRYTSEHESVLSFAKKWKAAEARVTELEKALRLAVKQGCNCWNWGEDGHKRDCFVPNAAQTLKTCEPAPRVQPEPPFTAKEVIALIESADWQKEYLDGEEESVFIFLRAKFLSAPEYLTFQRTKPVVDYLISCRDQVASTEDIAEALDNDSGAVRDALQRLEKVGRVAEIHNNLWHLE